MWAAQLTGPDWDCTEHWPGPGHWMCQASVRTRAPVPTNWSRVTHHPTLNITSAPSYPPPASLACIQTPLVTVFTWSLHCLCLVFVIHIHCHTHCKMWELFLSSTWIGSSCTSRNLLPSYPKAVSHVKDQMLAVYSIATNVASFHHLSLSLHFRAVYSLAGSSSI